MVGNSEYKNEEKNGRRTAPPAESGQSVAMRQNQNSNAFWHAPRLRTLVISAVLLTKFENL